MHIPQTSDAGQVIRGPSRGSGGVATWHAMRVQRLTTGCQVVTMICHGQFAATSSVSAM